MGKNPDQIEKVLSLVQNTFQTLTYLREDIMGSSSLLIEGVTSKASDHESIIWEVEFLNKHSSSKDF